MSDRPTIVVTGASGFLGSRVVRTLRETHRVVAIDRQPRGEAGIDDDPNVVWHRIDLADRESVRTTFEQIRRDGGARALLHLAAYYDFTGEVDPEYERTNVRATRLVAEHSLGLGLRRFMFASSVAACDFSTPGRPITEGTPPQGRHVYAMTKRAGEDLLREWRDRLPSCIVRFAALFSDWCEYPPLYFFLETWLSDRWNARILGGRGGSAIPFLHVRDATRFVLRVLDRANDLGPAEVLLCSPDGAVSHRQLFDAATGYRFGRRRDPIHMPKLLCRPGMWARDLAGRILGNRPFERSWMASYVDREMVVDASRSHRRLDWTPRDRLRILNRIPFMIENARTSPMEWYGRNLEALEHREMRPRFQVYRLVRKLEPDIRRALVEWLRAVGDRSGDAETREWIARSALRALIHAIRTGEKSPFRMYCRDLAERFLDREAPLERVVGLLQGLEEAFLEVVVGDPGAAGLEDALNDSIRTTFRFGVDRVVEEYENRERA